MRARPLLMTLGALALVTAGTSLLLVRKPEFRRRTALPAGTPVSNAYSIEGYTGWTRVNPKPVYIPPPLYYACASAAPPTSPEWSPHNGGFIDVYVNQPARTRMLEGGKDPYPAGTVIVKEKRKQAKAGKPELLTVMRKREAGFDPAHGDWEYELIHAPKPKIETSKRVDHCQACHEQVKGNDYVFGNYVPKGKTTGAVASNAVLAP